MILHLVVTALTLKNSNSTNAIDQRWFGELWVNPDAIEYGVNSLRLGNLYLFYVENEQDLVKIIAKLELIVWDKSFFRL